MDPAVVLGKYEWVLIWGLSTFQEVFGSIAYLYVSIIYIYIFIYCDGLILRTSFFQNFETSS
jgi:hypothetical protein